MKKSHAFNVMSDQTCTTILLGRMCNNKIKLRLVETKHPKNVRKCFKCHKIHEAARGHFIKRIPYLAFKKHIK